MFVVLIHTDFVDVTVKLCEGVGVKLKFHFDHNDYAENTRHAHIPSNTLTDRQTQTHTLIPPPHTHTRTHTHTYTHTRARAHTHTHTHTHTH